MVNALNDHYCGKIKIRLEKRNSNPLIQDRLAAWNAKIRNKNGDIGILIDPSMQWALYCINNLKYKTGTSLIDEPSPHQINNDNKLKFLRHIIDSLTYPVELYDPIRIIELPREQRRKEYVDPFWEKLKPKEERKK